MIIKLILHTNWITMLFFKLENGHKFVIEIIKKNQIMKKTIKNTLVVMAMLGTITGYANLKPSLHLNENVKTTMLTLDDVREGQLLLIKSKNGTILYKESISKTGDYSKEFDLTSLPNGNYFFELEKDMLIQIIPFNVSSNTVNFLKDKEVKIFKPVVTSKKNKLYVSKLSLDLQPLTIEIYYKESQDSNSYEKIYTQKIENTKVIERIYALDKNIPGTYKIVTKADGRSYSQTFTF